jgi:hypothetical protein
MADDTGCARICSRASAGPIARHIAGTATCVYFTNQEYERDADEEKKYQYRYLKHAHIASLTKMSFFIHPSESDS